MDALTLLAQALQCDRAGRILEAQYLYKEGINELGNMSNYHEQAIEEESAEIPATSVWQRITKFLRRLLSCGTAERNLDKNRALNERIRKYLDRAKQIEIHVKNQSSGGKVVKHISIEEDSTGHSYETLFGEYLNDSVWEILLDEPYVTERYHFQNLLIFFELVVKKCPNMKYLGLVTRPCKKVDSSQSLTLEQMQINFKRYNKTLNVTYDGTLHDRKIVLRTAGHGIYIIKIGFGLHFFKPTYPLYTLGLCDYDFRKCKQTDIDILYTKK